MPIERPLRLLFAVPYMPSQVRVRPYYLARTLAQRGHAVTVLAPAESEADMADARRLTEQGVSVEAFPLPRWRTLSNGLLALPTRQPLQAAYAWQPQLAGRLSARLAGCDVVHVEHLRGARYGLAALRTRTGQTPPVIWDSVDCISLLFRQAARLSDSRFGRILARLDLARTERYEGWLVGQFAQVLVTAGADRQALMELARRANVTPRLTVVTNGVDTDYFRPNPDRPRDPATVVVSGKMSYHANISMVQRLVRRILPRVWSVRPDVRLVIAGKSPPAAVTALARHPQITVTGTVSDLRPYLQQATLAAAPLTYGVGLQNKILEAMACGAPVIASPLALAALAGIPGRDLVAADDDEAFAAAILDLLAQPERRSALSAAGLTYVHRHHHWPTLVADLEDVYFEALDRVAQSLA